MTIYFNSINISFIYLRLDTCTLHWQLTLTFNITTILHTYYVFNIRQIYIMFYFNYTHKKWLSLNYSAIQQFIVNFGLTNIKYRPLFNTFDIFTKNEKDCQRFQLKQILKLIYEFLIKFKLYFLIYLFVVKEQNETL